MINIIETQRLLNELSSVYSKANKLIFDNIFVSCLAEEIDKFFTDNPSLNEAVVRFTVDENSDVIYNGVIKEKIDDGWLYITTKRYQPTEADLLKEQLLTMKRLENKNISIQERKALMEKIDLFTKEINEYKNQLNMSLSVEEKKDKLLDKLLKD